MTTIAATYSTLRWRAAMFALYGFSTGIWIGAAVLWMVL